MVDPHSDQLPCSWSDRSTGEALHEHLRDQGSSPVQVWIFIVNEFLVSKETVVLCRWERSKQKFGFIKRVDKGWITTVKDLESWRFER